MTQLSISREGRQAFAGVPCLLALLLLGPGHLLGQDPPPVYPESVAGNGIADGPASPPPVSTLWLEALTENSSTELDGSTANLLLTNTTDLDLDAQVVLTLERSGVSSQHALNPLHLSRGGSATLPVNLLAYRQGESGRGDTETSFLFAHLHWTSSDQDRGGQSASPVLYFFQRSTGQISAFGEGELQRRLRADGDVPEARLLDREVAEEGTALEMIFEVDANEDRGNPISFDETTALDEERRLLRSRTEKSTYETTENSEMEQ